MLEEAGFVDVRIGPHVDTFAGAGGEEKARAFDVFGYAFLARKPYGHRGHVQKTCHLARTVDIQIPTVLG